MRWYGAQDNIIFATAHSRANNKNYLVEIASYFTAFPLSTEVSCEAKGSWYKNTDNFCKTQR